MAIMKIQTIENKRRRLGKVKGKDMQGRECRVARGGELVTLARPTERMGQAEFDGSFC